MKIKYKLEDLILESTVNKYYESKFETNNELDIKFEKLALRKFLGDDRMESHINGTDLGFIYAATNLFNEFHLIRMLYDYYFDIYEHISYIRLKSVIYKTDDIIIKNIMLDLKSDYVRCHVSVTYNDIQIRINLGNYTIICLYHGINASNQTLKYYIENNFRNVILNIIFKYQSNKAYKISPLA